MEEDIQNYLSIVMFRGTPCIRNVVKDFSNIRLNCCLKVSYRKTFRNISVLSKRKKKIYFYKHFYAFHRILTFLMKVIQFLFNIWVKDLSRIVI